METNRNVYLSMEETMVRLDLNRPGVYRLVKHGKLTGQKFGRTLRFGPAEVDSCAEELTSSRNRLREVLVNWSDFFASRLDNGRSAVRGDDETEQKSCETVADLGERILRDAIAQGAGSVFFVPTLAGLRLLHRNGTTREITCFEDCLSGELIAWLKSLAGNAADVSPLNALPDAANPVGDPGGNMPSGLFRNAMFSRTWEGSVHRFRIQENTTLTGSYYRIDVPVDFEAMNLELPGCTPDQVTRLQNVFSQRPGLLLYSGTDTLACENDCMYLAHFWARLGNLVVCIGQRYGFQSERLLHLRYGGGAGNDFETVWQAALDLRPDVLVIDELADTARFRALLEAANQATGVLAPIRSVGRNDVLRKLHSFDFDSSTLSRTLLGGIERVDLRKLCRKCAGRRLLEADELNILKTEPGTEAGIPVGCASCRKGYDGRIAAYGIWSVDEKLMNWIAESKGTNPPPGPDEDRLYVPLRKAVLSREVTPEEALIHAAGACRNKN